MARRIKTVTATITEPTETKRNRRTPEQIVADLQAEIERVKARAAAQQAKADPQARALLTAAKALDKAGAGCTGDVGRALEAARALLGEQIVAMGIRAPQPRRKRQEAA